MKMTSKILDWQAFSVMKFCKCQNLNSLFSEISFLELPKYPWNWQILSIIEKLKNWKIISKNKWKICLLVGEIENLARLLYFGTLS